MTGDRTIHLAGLSQILLCLYQGGEQNVRSHPLPRPPGSFRLERAETTMSRASRGIIHARDTCIVSPSHSPCIKLPALTVEYITPSTINAPPRTVFGFSPPTSFSKAQGPGAFSFLLPLLFLTFAQSPVDCAHPGVLDRPFLTTPDSFHHGQ